VKGYISRQLLRLLRRDRVKKYEELVSNAFLSAEKLNEQQESSFLELIGHARENVPYYGKILNDIEIRSIADIASIPPLTKKLIRQNFEDLKAVNLPPDRFVPNSTGGSTGEKLEFFSDTDQILASLLMRSNSWTGWEPGEKQLQLWGAHYDISLVSGLAARLKNSLIQRNLLLSSYDMTTGDMAGYLEKINSYRPALITGYPSAMALFAEFIKDRGAKVHTPKGIVTSAETLFEHQRETIESVFGCKVLNRYGCREAGGVAQECAEQNGLHIFSEHVIIEILDEKGEPCGPGRTGEIVVTVLDNYAFPLIRYRIGDIGALSDRTCPCGRNLPMLEKVEGRVFDIVVGTNGNHLSGTYWTILLREYVEGISSFQVVQEELGKLLLRLVTDEKFDDEAGSKLTAAIKEKCGQDMTVEIEKVDEIPLTGTGKHRFVVSKVSPYADERGSR
jgi:phenylacetate-CoA ligase